MESILDTNVLNNDSLNVACAAFGQGGYSMMCAVAVELGINPENCFAINTSKADLLKASFVPQANRLLIAPEGNGAGKDRSLVFNMITQTNEDILNAINTKLDGNFNMFLTFYSADGGTGSGAGPAMTALLTGEKLKKSGIAPVIGICALPDHFVGKDALKNTIENLNQTNKLLNMGAIRVMFVDNEVYSATPDKARRWAQINEDVARLLKRYLIQNFLSSSQNLDFSDRMKCLDQVGQHAILKINPANGEFTSPFILPEGVNVSKLAVEIPTGHPDLIEKLKSSIGCTVSEESFSGLYDEGIEGAYPVVHFAGFYNVEKLAAVYDGWLKQIIQKEQSQKKIDVEKGSGFKDIGKINDYIKEESSVKELNSFTDIFAALGGE